MSTNKIQQPTVDFIHVDNRHPFNCPLPPYRSFQVRGYRSETQRSHRSRPLPIINPVISRRAEGKDPGYLIDKLTRKWSHCRREGQGRTAHMSFTGETRPAVNQITGEGPRGRWVTRTTALYYSLAPGLPRWRGPASPAASSGTMFRSSSALAVPGPQQWCSNLAGRHLTC